jgi:hypothetical protein
MIAEIKKEGGEPWKSETLFIHNMGRRLLLTSYAMSFSSKIFFEKGPSN